MNKGTDRNSYVPSFPEFRVQIRVHQRYVQLKRKNTYYIKIQRTIEGDTREIVRTLETGNRRLAEKRQQLLDDRIEKGGDPFSQSFNWDVHPKRTWWEIDECKDEFLETKKKYRYYTWKSYKDVIGKFIRYQNLSGKLIRSVTIQHFEDFLMRDGIKNVSRHSEKRKLKTFWNWLIKKDRIDVDLLSEINLPQKNVEYYPKMITKKELNAVFEAYRKHTKSRKQEPWYREFMNQSWFIPAMNVFFYSGFRRSEVGYDNKIDHSGLKGEHIFHKNNNSIDFIYRSKAKSNRERFVPVSNDLEEELLNYFKKRGWPKQDEYVFLNGKGQPVTGRNMLDVFKGFCKKANIPKTRTIHGMRHSRATLWLKMGFTLKEVKEMLGHYSIEITDRLYTHISPDSLKEKMELLEEHVETV